MTTADKKQLPRHNDGTNGDRASDSDGKRRDRLKENLELEKEASELTIRIGSLSDGNTLDRQYLKQMESAVAAEVPPVLDSLERLYGEVKIVLPETATRRFEEVRAFHESVVRNRFLYLEAEINDTRHRIAVRDAEKDSLDKRRAQVMGILHPHGALDHFNRLQAELNKLEADCARCGISTACASMLACDVKAACNGCAEEGGVEIVVDKMDDMVTVRRVLRPYLPAGTGPGTSGNAKSTKEVSEVLYRAVQRDSGSWYEMDFRTGACDIGPLSDVEVEQRVCAAASSRSERR